MLPAIFNPENIDGNKNRIKIFIVNILPAKIIGEAVGDFIAELIGGEK